MRTLRCSSHVESSLSFSSLLILSLAVTLASTIVAPSAFAVSVSISNVTSSAGTAPLAIGDTVTLEFALANQRADIYAVGISIHGYDDSIADFVSGDAAVEFMSPMTLSDGSPVGGFLNYAQSRSANAGTTSVVETDWLGGTRSVELFQSVSLSAITGSGALDYGVSGTPVAAGDVHARVTFRLLASGTTTLFIDSDREGDALVLTGGALGSAVGTSFSFYEGLVIGNPPIPNPEPGTALLLGLGLMSLSAIRRG